MYARAIDRSAAELRELRHEELADLVFAALVVGLSLASTQLAPTVALPLFVGALYLIVRCVRATFMHWDLLDRLLTDRDAYSIPEVRARAERLSSMKNRRQCAGALRRVVGEPRVGVTIPDRVVRCADDLTALAAELEDDRLELDPFAAAACDRLLTDGGSSALYNSSLPADDLRASICRIRAGFAPRS